MPRFVDLTGQIFGELLVIERAPNKGRHTYWLCKCLRTGKTGEVESGALKSGHTSTSRAFLPKPMQDFDNLEDYLKQFSWNLTAGGHHCAGTQKIQLKRHIETWRFYYGNPPEGYEIDHIDGNGSNDDISNLRLLTHQQNLLNTSPRKNGTSKYKGVSWDKERNKWMLNINHKGYKRITRRFDLEKEAAFGYNIYMKYHASRELVLEHNLPGNVSGRFIPILNNV